MYDMRHAFPLSRVRLKPDAVYSGTKMDENLKKD